MSFNVGFDPRYAVRTSDRKLNALGVGPDQRTARQKKNTISGEQNPDYLPPPHRTAPVLVTTQQKLLRMSRYSWNTDFEENSFYQYEGKPSGGYMGRGDLSHPSDHPHGHAD
jgi:hypothetical protein